MIADINILKEFYISVIPEINEEECILMLLAARKKYCKQLPRSEEMLHFEILRHNSFNKFLSKVKKLTYTDGIYLDKNGNEIESTCIAPYVILDPKHTIKAWFKLQKEINDLIYQLIKGDKTALYQLRKIDVKWFSCLHRSQSRKLYWIIDIDSKDNNLINYVIDKLRNHIRWVSETRGGYHVIVDTNETSSKLIFKDKVFSKYSMVEIHKEPMTPIPGCLQGGFMVKKYGGD